MTVTVFYLPAQSEVFTLIDWKCYRRLPTVIEHLLSVPTKTTRLPRDFRDRTSPQITLTRQRGFYQNYEPGGSLMVRVAPQGFLYTAVMLQQLAETIYWASSKTFSEYEPITHQHINIRQV